MDKPQNILEEALDITANDRQRYYGHPSDNHGNTAALWSAYLQRKFNLSVPLTVRDVCLMMVLLKVSRDANKPQRDNLVDICGYTRNIEQAAEREVTRCEIVPDPNTVWRDQAAAAMKLRTEKNTPWSDSGITSAPAALPPPTVPLGPVMGPFASVPEPARQPTLPGDPHWTARRPDQSAR